MMSPALAEAPRPNARHAESRHRAHFVKRHLEELAEQNRIEVSVPWTGAVPRLQQRDRFVQIVHHRRVIFVEHSMDRACELQRFLMRVAVVIVIDVVAPVGRRQRRQGFPVGSAFQVAIEPVDCLVAAVWFRDWVDQDDQVAPDILDQWLFGDGETIRQLHDHFRATGFGRM
jgi:hypothetical protein